MSKFESNISHLPFNAKELPFYVHDLHVKKAVIFRIYHKLLELQKCNVPLQAASAHIISMIAQEQRNNPKLKLDDYKVVCEAPDQLRVFLDGEEVIVCNRKPKITYQTITVKSAVAV
jgi:hypothetical protein